MGKKKKDSEFSCRGAEEKQIYYESYNENYKLQIANLTTLKQRKEDGDKRERHTGGEIVN